MGWGERLTKVSGLKVRAAKTLGEVSLEGNAYWYGVAPVLMARPERARFESSLGEARGDAKTPT